MCEIGFEIFAVDAPDPRLREKDEYLKALAVGEPIPPRGYRILQLWVSKKNGELWSFAPPPNGGKSIYELGQVDEDEFVLNMTSRLTKRDSRGEAYELIDWTSSISGTSTDVQVESAVNLLEEIGPIPEEPRELLYWTTTITPTAIGADFQTVYQFADGSSNIEVGKIKDVTVPTQRILRMRFESINASRVVGGVSGMASISITYIPEPSSAALFAVASITLLAARGFSRFHGRRLVNR